MEGKLITELKEITACPVAFPDFSLFTAFSVSSSIMLQSNIWISNVTVLCYVQVIVLLSSHFDLPRVMKWDTWSWLSLSTSSKEGLCWWGGWLRYLMSLWVLKRYQPASSKESSCHCTKVLAKIPLTVSYRCVTLTSAIANAFEYIFLTWMESLLKKHGMPHCSQTAYQWHMSCRCHLCHFKNLAKVHKLGRQGLCMNVRPPKGLWHSRVQYIPIWTISFMQESMVKHRDWWGPGMRGPKAVCGLDGSHQNT